MKVSRAIAVLLKEERLAQGLSASKLAEMSGLNRQAITFIERGERTPSIESFSRIAYALGKSPTNIFKEAESTLLE